VNLDQLASLNADSEINPETLGEARLLRDPRKPVVLLGRGDVKVALKVRVHRISKSAAEKITAAGGSVETSNRLRVGVIHMKWSAWRYLWTAQDVRRKLLITIGILAIYRFVSHVPVPGANPEAIAGILGGGGAAGSFIGILDLLSGGTVKNFSVLAMGVYPYITSQIILQLLIPIVPAFKARMEEDPREGKKWMEKWTYMLAVPWQLAGDRSNQYFQQSCHPGRPAAGDPTLRFQLRCILLTMTIILSMTAGTMFAIWLGELISEYGIRNQGLSLIIFSGIVSQIPMTFIGLWADEQTRWFSMASSCW
jgi:preprotein translocase subunit SecY